jgi:hypothetical protein
MIARAKLTECAADAPAEEPKVKKARGKKAVADAAAEG